MNKLLQQLSRIALVGALVSTSTFSADILKADRQYTAKQYDLAKDGYLEAAKLGNPHAYYQLATMYQQGLGVEKDALNALIYVSLAADYDLEKAHTTLQTLLSPLNENQKKTVNKILAEYKETKGKAAIQQLYFPQLITENLKEKFTFEGEPSIDPKFYVEDINSDEYTSAYDGLSTFDDNGDQEDEDSFDLLMTPPKLPFLIVEHDIGPDGSKRNMFDIQKMGSTLTIRDEYKLFPTAIPTFKGEPTEFVHRAYMGAATYSKFTMVQENEPMYANILRSVKDKKNSTELNAQYEYVMALQNFSWVTQEEGEVAQRLLALSKLGHPGAMYEYGMKLYREQTDIKEAIKWIGLASSYGLTRAEYRLGRLFVTSPWVKYDEHKALFWFEMAAEKDHAAAALKAAELKLTTTSPELFDVQGAIDLLAQIEQKQHTNPEYFYVLAQSYRKRENRDFSQVIKHLEKAIFMGSSANWDVSEWQDLLSKLTQGNVYITE
ncbi:tetratricopeptide repeat protein [Paraglaciecola sp.]|uniref:tetratricopeptide repeat protein n=1 Tax=Paraglaciecola sp. TaxID=1920173 RepID=UPI003EF8E20F